MPDKEALQIGRDFEETVNEALGLNLTVSSGNQWQDRGDNRGRGLRVSAKANPVAKRSWPETREQLREAIEIAHGTGQLPLLAIQDQDNSQLIVMRLEDFAELLGREAGELRKPKRSEIVRATAAVPLMRRAARSGYDDDRNGKKAKRHQ